jgi:hypothetical protein
MRALPPSARAAAKVRNLRHRSAMLLLRWA